MIIVKEFRNIMDLEEYMEHSKGLFVNVYPVSKMFEDKERRLISTINYVLVERV